MANILTPNEAANFLRTDNTDPVMLMLLPAIDESIRRATGRDWSQDVQINNVAKAAAGMLLVQWYDTPSQSGSQITESPLAFGLTHVLSQLEVEALKYRKYSFYGASQAGGIAVAGVCVGDIVQKLVGVYGVSGDQSAMFESTISVYGQIQQINGGDLSGNIYAVILKSPADDVSA
jgi:hypothetical protein